ncbi:ATPase [Chitinimonas arctica]|uniref:histidine kinase n=1 Tax=Chitinimonas arctica TaxID=2594795 RepID=A0A516SA17_9NEIS|nr:ATP-binding protein [Chitinimonas arctica]QDQ25001.1 ATPase [Chitinimonas arctica]
MSAYIKDLLGLVSSYTALEGNLSEQDRQVMNRFKQKIDLEFLMEDVGSLLEQSNEGLTRVKKIVQDLKDFSRVDSSDSWQKASLVDCMESTLSIVNNEIKYKANLVRNFQPLPYVDCMPSQINQVFLNILVNAAHAIEGGLGTITINMYHDDKCVWVEITDTGKGIAPEIRDRIFDPFFTTKPIGQGTGLGLSISYGIIRKHNGSITIESELGKGTTFRIGLPIEQAG